MNAITFECETITPMFLGGADGRTPELRPPSIKGAMRFWWRAMNGHLPLEDLKKKEARIFGGSGEKEGRSRIVLRVKSDKELKKGNNIKANYSLKCNYNKQKKRMYGDDVGICYLLYSTILGDGLEHILKITKNLQ
jgi:CRISPR-associated protein Cmr1